MYLKGVKNYLHTSILHDGVNCRIPNDAFFKPKDTVQTRYRMEFQDKCRPHKNTKVIFAMHN